ncbi:molybdenum cofactor biosynthesis protein B [Aliiglaciecola sp. CAU 1673]|uniref:molybdenum cofactor biosynthesis protein B n=1 Tax=Aliiglaciecola sp. CAU 1673 TaxID=3032595 RepID=UPI0023D9FE26|nr:molybdenum cofactor biosynthesis protein B [Aliiglaciecola sp. CAU 1673]MDF2177397.1 molybdenum cofactor biosynthesis protein B [Aliiglaciecola sp. CAU 1673]
MTDSIAATPLNIAVLTVSDHRDQSNDSSGQYLADALAKAGHRLAVRSICTENLYQLRAQLSQWIADSNVQVVLVNGGTGFNPKNCVPEALCPLFDTEIEGFGELFRHLSYQEIGTSALQSRALAGLANQTLIFCIPGSTGACKTAWEGIIREQLDAAHGPCNFVPHISNQNACERRPGDIA